ncbi:MAG: type II toxin-antitoxin system RelE/ParE family toxin [Alphaproteobacteria bacterium]
MSRYLVLDTAGLRIDEIYLYTAQRWGEEQANAYIEGLFKLFARIASKQVLWKPIPAEFGVRGYYTKYEKHFVFWKELASGETGIASILHERMDMGHHLDRDFA